MWRDHKAPSRGQIGHHKNRDLTPDIIGAAIRVHRRLGPGWLEPAYEACLAYELQQMGLRVERQKAVRVVYHGVKVDCGFRADLVVGGRVAVELKCKDALHPVDEAQVLSHPRLLNLRMGLLINFHVVMLKDGIRRMVYDYRESDYREVHPSEPKSLTGEFVHALQGEAQPRKIPSPQRAQKSRKGREDKQLIPVVSNAPASRATKLRGLCGRS